MSKPVTENDLQALDTPLGHGMTRRTFTRGALAAALAGPLLSTPAFQRLSKAADFKGKTLKFLIINPHAGSIEPLSAAFAQATGATVEGVKVPYDQITAQATLDVVSGSNNFDVFEYWYAAKGALVRDNVVLDLTDRIAADPSIDPSDFIGSIYDTYTLVNGRRYGLPYDGDTHVLYYNQEILDRNGLKPPTTWDEYLEVTKAVTEKEKSKGIYGALVQGKQIPVILGSSFANRLGGFGGDFLDKDGKPALTSDAALGALKALIAAAPYAVPTALETEFGNAIPVWLSGKAALIEFWTDLGTWSEDPKQSQIVGKWGVVPPPVGGGNKTNRPALNAGFGFAVSAGSKQPDVAWEFVKLSASKDFHVKVLTNNTTGVDPTRKSALPAYQKFAPKQAAAVEAAIANSFPWPTVPQAPDLLQSLTDELGLALAGKKPAEKALADAQASWLKTLGG
jgi:multiple sugar transport system substrate-binding protein